jgi:hypothetical protein
MKPVEKGMRFGWEKIEEKAVYSLNAYPSVSYLCYGSHVAMTPAVKGSMGRGRPVTRARDRNNTNRLSTCHKYRHQNQTILYHYVMHVRDRHNTNRLITCHTYRYKPYI